VEGNADSTGDWLVIAHRGDKPPLSNCDNRSLVEIGRRCGEHTDARDVPVCVDSHGEHDVGMLSLA
jgi:hypothetical protein